MKKIINYLDLIAKATLIYVVLFQVWFPTVDKIDRLEADLAITNEEVLMMSRELIMLEKSYFQSEKNLSWVIEQELKRILQSIPKPPQPKPEKVT